MIIDLKNNNEVIHIEEMSLNAWPALTELHHQGSVLRFSNGYTKRSNSVNALYGSGSGHETIGYAERLYSKNSLPTIFKILKLEQYESLDGELAGRGYSVLDATNVKVLDLRTRAFTEHTEVEIADGFSQKWIDEFILSNHLESSADTVEQILRKIRVDTIVASITVDSKIVAFGFGAIEENVVGIFDILVNESYRTRGYARMIMNELLRVSRKRKIDYSYLQVVAANAIANKLYESFSYQPYYSYWYRIKNRC